MTDRATVETLIAGIRGESEAAGWFDAAAVECRAKFRHCLCDARHAKKVGAVDEMRRHLANAKVWRAMEQRRRKDASDYRAMAQTLTEKLLALLSPTRTEELLCVLPPPAANDDEAAHAAE